MSRPDHLQPAWAPFRLMMIAWPVDPRPNRPRPSRSFNLGQSILRFWLFLLAFRAVGEQGPTRFDNIDNIVDEVRTKARWATRFTPCETYSE